VEKLKSATKIIDSTVLIKEMEEAEKILSDLKRRVQE
jgi:hypothetical protein